MNSRYEEYLKSDKWKKKREKILKRADHKCELCGSTENLHIHHLTYDNVYNEKEEDLLCVCDICHSKLHNKDLTKKGFTFAKNGWCRMYPKDYAEAMTALIGKNNAQKIWWFFIKNGFFKKDGTIKNFTQKQLAEKLGIKRPNVSRALKQLKDLELIAEIDGELRYNPFIQTVAGQSDQEISEAQNIWEKEVGFYVFDKNDKKYKSKYQVKNK